MGEAEQHPEVERYAFAGATWPSDRPFPLTPTECWFILQGWAVRPKAPRPIMELYDELPGERTSNCWADTLRFERR